MKPKLSLLAAVVFAVSTLPAGAADWPQFRGPQRDGISKETGLLKEWPKEGPPLAWKVKELGGGYSAPSIVGGRIFGMSYRGGDEVIWALDEKDGKEQWATRLGAAYRQKMPQGSEGPACTPTIDGDLAYALGIGGDLVCVKTADGKEVWRKSLTGDFRAEVQTWGYRESPLVDGDQLIVTPGGKDATLVALNKKTGDVVWKAHAPDGDSAGYASAIAIDCCGQRQYVQFTHKGLVGVAASDGKFLWRSNKSANGVANCAMPIFSDDCIFTASAYGGGGALVKLTKDGDGVKVEEVYSTKKMQNHHGGVILFDGCLYGANGGNEGGNLVCLDFKTGDVKWDERDDKKHRVPKGSTTLADGRLYYRHEDGTMTLIEPSAKEYLEHGRFDQPERSRSNAWSYPVIANGKLYLRDQGVLLCYDIKDPAAGK